MDFRVVCHWCAVGRRAVFAIIINFLDNINE